jgi:hypothetical protein
MGAREGTSEGAEMKNPNFSFVETVKEREDGAPADYARYGAKQRDQLAETDVMLALFLDKDEEKPGFDPYNSIAG